MTTKLDYTADKLDLSLLSLLTLSSGAHETRKDGLCLMEAAAWIAGKAHSDSPPCVAPSIAAFGRSLNDVLPSNETRDRLLLPILPALIGTATGKKDELTRSWMALDWCARTFAPAFLRLRPELAAAADALAALEPLLSSTGAEAALPALEEARVRSAAAWAAARAAAGAAARDAAWDAAWAAARAAARDAARAAAGDAARAAAGDAARAAAGAAARDAAWDAAWAAAGAAARDAARAAARAAAGDAAWDAAWDAARAALQPTVETLQSSAVDLLRRMASVGRASS